MSVTAAPGLFAAIGDRRQLAHLVDALDSAAARATLAVPASIVRPGASTVSAARMAAELGELAREAAAWQAATA